MSGRFPAIEPYDHGMLAVGDGNEIYWEVSGNPNGKPALAIHGGPGSGSGPGWRRWFDPDRYRIVLFDQRGCGLSTPQVSDYATDLSVNTTHHLISDLELLRGHLGIDRWLLFGASWGTTLGLAYAQRFPEHVSEIVMASVVMTTEREVSWVTREMGRIFPEAWKEFRDGVPAAERDGHLATAYSRLLNDPDPDVRDKAGRDWCAWEDTHVSLQPGWQPDERYEDPIFRYQFARLVTHYWSNAAWLQEDELLRNATKLNGIPGVLVQGRLDVSGPPDIAWQLAQVWTDSEFVLIEDAGHGPGESNMTEVLVAATNRFANVQSSR